MPFIYVYVKWPKWYSVEPISYYQVNTQSTYLYISFGKIQRDLFVPFDVNYVTCIISQISCCAMLSDTLKAFEKSSPPHDSEPSLIRNVRSKFPLLVKDDLSVKSHRIGKCYTDLNKWHMYVFLCLWQYYVYNISLPRASESIFPLWPTKPVRQQPLM